MQDLIDPLTQLATEEALNNALEEAKHPKLYLLDIKGFGAINSRYGDDAGNFVLKQLSLALKVLANEKEMQVFRVANDEFALLEDKPFDLEAMEKMVFSLIAFGNQQTYTYAPLETEFEIDLTIGICFDRFKLLEKAYKALALAKAHNRPFVTYSEFVNQEWTKNEEFWATIIDKAIAEKRLFPHFQAIVDKEGSVLYHEALSRITIENETKSPGEFLQIAKSQNLTTSLTKAMFQAIKDSPENIALNLSLEDLSHKETGLMLKQDHSLLFELSASHLHVEGSSASNFLETMQLPREKIVLDNFMNLSIFDHTIKPEQVGFIKIHGDLIKNLLLDAIAVKRVEQIIAFAKEHDIKTIATHINAQATFEKSKELGFDYFQGYFFQVPTPEPSTHIKG